MTTITEQLENCIDATNETAFELCTKAYPPEVADTVCTALQHLKNALEVLQEDYNYPA